MTDTTPASDPVADSPLVRLTAAAWGVCWGVLLASIVVTIHIAVNGDTEDRPHPNIIPSESLNAFVRIPWQERYERIWYVLLCVCGAIGGLAATRFLRPAPWLAAISAGAFLAAAPAACESAFSVNPDILQFLLCGSVLLLPLLRRHAALASPPTPSSIEIAPSRMWVAAGLLCLPLAALLCGLLAPADLRSAASECYAESHVASYLIGPALYYRSPDAVPGIDFESHYGIGHASTFSLVMGNHGFERTMERYIVFVVVVTSLYLLSAFFVLTDWLRNPYAAFGVTLLLIATTFEGVSYRYPSNWPVRHPFAFVFLFCAVRGVNCSRWCIAAGVVAGLSLFWQTDIGLYTFAAGGALFIANALFLRGAASRLFVFLVAGVGAFFVVCFALFGPRVLSGLFVARLFEPLLLYGTGFGNQLFNWQSDWGRWYNLAGPGIAVASVALWLGYRREVPPRAVLYSAAASLLGLAMLFKWVNRSIDVVWALNGGLVIAVAGCWAWFGWRALCTRLSSQSHPAQGYLRQLAAGAALLLAVGVGVWLDREFATSPYQGGSSSPLVRITDRLDGFANPINAARKPLTPRTAPVRLDTNTITYLRANTRKTERVAVICREDWRYLAAAGRAPRLHWVQLFLVHSPELLGRCIDDLRNSDRVFVHNDALVSLRKVNPTAHDHVMQTLDGHFGPPEWTPCEWVVYHQKPGPTAKR